MRKLLLACAAVAALVSAAPAQNLPTLTQFLGQCFRDGQMCRQKIKDYVNAAVSQNSMCLPKDVSVNTAVGEMLHWLRDDTTHPASLDEQPFDDALYEASKKLYPCAPPPETPPPPPPPEAPPQQPQP
jgi:hypothetical protein